MIEGVRLECEPALVLARALAHLERDDRASRAQRNQLLLDALAHAGDELRAELHAAEAVMLLQRREPALHGLRRAAELRAARAGVCRDGGGAQRAGAGSGMSVWLRALHLPWFKS